MMKKIGLFVLLAALLTACSMVASTGDTASDPAAAQQFLPTIPGYTVTEAATITDALTAAGVGGSLLTGNAPLAAAIGKLDDMMRCYEGVGAVAARVYTQVDIGSVVQGQIPKVGALAVINETRIERNFLNCALSVGSGLSAQSADEIQPCGGSGSTTVNNERITYVYGATTPELCVIFQQQFPPSR
jgi:hypothetical protein